MGNEYKKQLVIGTNKLFLTHKGKVRLFDPQHQCVRPIRTEHAGCSQAYKKSKGEYHESNRSIKNEVDPGFVNAKDIRIVLNDPEDKIEDIHCLYDKKGCFCLLVTRNGFLYVTAASNFTAKNVFIIRPKLIKKPGRVTVWRMRNTPANPLFLYVVREANNAETIYSLSVADIMAHTFRRIFLSVPDKKRVESLWGCPDRLDVTYNDGTVLCYPYKKSTLGYLSNKERTQKLDVLPSFGGTSDDVIEHVILPYLNDCSPFLKVSRGHRQNACRTATWEFEHGRFRRAYSSPYFYKMAELELGKRLHRELGARNKVVNASIADCPQLFLNLVFSCVNPHYKLAQHCIRILDIITGEEQIAGDQYFYCLSKHFKIHRGIVFCVSYGVSCCLQMYNIADRQWKPYIRLDCPALSHPDKPGATDYRLICSGDVVYMMHAGLSTLLEINYLRRTQKKLNKFSREIIVGNKNGHYPEYSFLFGWPKIIGNHLIALGVGDTGRISDRVVCGIICIFDISNQGELTNIHQLGGAADTCTVYDKFYVIGSNRKKEIVFSDCTNFQKVEESFQIGHCPVQELKVIDGTMYVLTGSQEKGGWWNYKHQELIAYKIDKGSATLIHKYALNIKVCKILGRIENFFILQNSEKGVIITTLDGFLKTCDLKNPKNG